MCDDFVKNSTIIQDMYLKKQLLYTTYTISARPCSRERVLICLREHHAMTNRIPAPIPIQLRIANIGTLITATKNS